MEETILENQENLTAEVVDIQFRPGQKIYYFDPAGITCKPGDAVIIDTARGPEYGICAGGNHRISTKDVVSPLRSVLRLATAQDERIVAENRAKEEKAYNACMQKINELELDMQLVSAECAFDGSKILFFFTADERVDFRELVKNLASMFHTRIELRQIGVRDKAKMVGGLGICGRPFCCASFLDDFQPVSIKMAKTQNLSLNPTKISGTCGRLMCCLKYEQDAYEYLIQNSPKLESFVDTPEGRGTVVELDLLRQRVKVRMEDRPEVITAFANSDIAVLRNGKAKKNDPPIPADLAPISGSGKKPHFRDETEEAPQLEPIRFRYSEEAVVEVEEEPVIPEEEVLPAEPVESAESAAPKTRRRKSRRNRSQEAETAAPEAVPETPKPEKPQQEKPKPTKKPAKPKQPAAKPQEATEAPAPADEGEENGAPEQKKHRRRPYYHHRRRKSGAGEGGQG